MSSLDETSVEEDAGGPEQRENSARRRFGRRFQNGPHVAPGQRLLRSRQDKGSEGFQCKLTLQLDEMEGRSVIWGCQGRPGTPVDDKGNVLDCVPQLYVEGVKFGQPLPNRGAWGVRRQRSVRSSGVKRLASCGSRESGPSRGGAWAQNGVEAKQISAGPLHPRAAGGGWVWVTPRQDTTSKVMSSEDAQYPSSDSEFSDESAEIPITRMSISIKEKDQAKASSPTGLGGDTGKQLNAYDREGFVHMPGRLLTPASQGLTSGSEKLASGELEPLFCKKKQSVIWGKGGSWPSHPGSATDAAAPAGSLSKASPIKKPAQERKPLYAVSGVTLGSTFPPWGQRLKAAPVEPSAILPVIGVSLFGKGTRCTLVPSEPKPYKPRYTGKRHVGKKTKESKPTARERAEPTRDAALQPQSTKQPDLCTHLGAFRGGHPNTRATQAPGSSQLLALGQSRMESMSPASSGDLAQPLRLRLPFPERQQNPFGVQGCFGCQELKKDIDTLNEQLEAMFALVEKFQAL